MKIQEFQVKRSEIIQTDRYKAICERLGIPYFKVDFLTKDGIWRGRRVRKPNFRRLQVLVTGHGDCPLDEELFRRAKPCLRRWFSTNVIYPDPRLTGIPLGITNHTRETPVHAVIGNLEPLMECYDNPKKFRNLVYMNFRIDTYLRERQTVFNLFRGCRFVTQERDDKSPAGHRHFLQQIYHHPFVLCPRGNGIDTHRMWEALYLKSIPIVRRCYAMSVFDDLPILFVDRWEDALDPELLERKRLDFQTRDWNMEKLNLSYWEQQFRITQERLSSRLNILARKVRALFDSRLAN